MKAKRFVAACSMAAVILSSSAALALMYRQPTEHGLWWRGTTQLNGGGEVHSQYQDYVYYYSYARVMNARGVEDEMTLPSMYGAACAHAKAYAWENDYSYYDFWD